ncbi:nuclear pore complex protein nup85 [Phtheirospermum japonicum]|uniref:Nuclear pore complex protein Nup85 n=1 Tax=Phtheirospermum japonicum TaxID=374723 RepID=A0A830DMF3_9LAMI|nr:nuclear pore complex protein nup85 [Phtheirospermum japonicum]
MPGVTSDSGDFNSLSIVPNSFDAQAPRAYPLRTHSVTPPFARLSISWARGNTLRVSLLQQSEDAAIQDDKPGGEVVEVRLTNSDGGEIPDAQWRRIAYGSVAPFALLQSRKNSIETMHYDMDWWVHVMEYSKEIRSLLENSKPSLSPMIEDPKTVMKEVEEPTSLNAAWELMEMFYADKQSQTWIPERLLDWLSHFDCLFSVSQPTVHAKLVAFQEELVAIQAVENDPKYWEVLSSALAVGWLDVVVKLLRLHGSYSFDQLGARESTSRRNHVTTSPADQRTAVVAATNGVSTTAAFKRCPADDSHATTAAAAFLGVSPSATTPCCFAHLRPTIAPGIDGTPSLVTVPPSGSQSLSLHQQPFVAPPSQPFTVFLPPLLSTMQLLPRPTASSGFAGFIQPPSVEAAPTNGLHSMQTQHQWPAFHVSNAQTSPIFSFPSPVSSSASLTPALITAPVSFGSLPAARVSPFSPMINAVVNMSPGLTAMTPPVPTIPLQPSLSSIPSHLPLTEMKNLVTPANYSAAILSAGKSMSVMGNPISSSDWNPHVLTGSLFPAWGSTPAAQSQAALLEAQHPFLIQAPADFTTTQPQAQAASYAAQHPDLAQAHLGLPQAQHPSSPFSALFTWQWAQPVSTPPRPAPMALRPSPSTKGSKSLSIDDCKAALKVTWGIEFCSLGVVGNPLQIDERSINGSVGHFVRVLVEINLENTLHETVMIEREGYCGYISIRYEYLPDFCSFCKTVGHLVGSCPSYKPRVAQNVDRDDWHTVNTRRSRRSSDSRENQVHNRTDSRLTPEPTKPSLTTYNNFQVLQGEACTGPSAPPPFAGRTGRPLTVCKSAEIVCDTSRQLVLYEEPASTTFSSTSYVYQWTWVLRISQHRTHLFRKPATDRELVDIIKKLQKESSTPFIVDDTKSSPALHLMSIASTQSWADIAEDEDSTPIRRTENGLVEAVALLISQMPRLRIDLSAEKLGQCYSTKPEFMKAWDKWRAQLTKLDCSEFWLQCDHQQTRAGLKNMLQIMLGNASVLSSVTYHWIELYISHFLYIRPFTVGLESMNSLAQKCMHSKPMSNRHKLMRLLIGILDENTEVVLAECSRSFGPWMITHAIELLTAGSVQAETILHEQRSEIGGICMEELYRLIYAQILSSHAFTWNIAPIYLTSCMNQGLGLLENLLYKQPVQHNQALLKSIEICRLNGLDYVSCNMMKIAGVHDWKHGKKGSAVFWLQQARDEVRLNRIAKQLYTFVGKSVSDESFKLWEGMIELLGTESKTAGGLDFLKKYRDFRRSLQQVQDGITTDDARKAADALVSLLRNPSTPQQFWLPLLFDSLKLLNWQERPLFNVAQTNLLLNKLQELSLVKLLPSFVDAELPSEALKSVRLALATNLGRAILDE